MSWPEPLIAKIPSASSYFLQPPITFLTRPPPLWRPSSLGCLGGILSTPISVIRNNKTPWCTQYHLVRNMAASTATSINGCHLGHSHQEQSSDQIYASESPVESFNSYARTMHQHTKRQLELASHSSPRRSADPPTIATLGSQSSRGSVDSRAS